MTSEATLFSEVRQYVCGCGAVFQSATRHAQFCGECRKARILNRSRRAAERRVAERLQRRAMHLLHDVLMPGQRLTLPTPYQPEDRVA